MRQSTGRSKWFITGGAGLIGSHLVDKLIEAGDVVTVYDNLNSGKKGYIEQHFGKDEFRLIQADLLDFATLKQAMNGHDCIAHLGANVNIGAGSEKTDLDLKNGVIATYNVLEAMRANGAKKIIYASSSTVYGETPVIMPVAEDYGPLFPISLYAAGKLAGEGLVSAFCHLFGMQGWIFRFARVVGGRMTGGVIHDFIRKLRQNPDELEILGDGKQEKPFLTVEDCIEGILCAFRKSDKQVDVFNLGCNSTTPVDRVAQIVAEEMGLKNVKFKYTGGSRGWPGDVLHLQYNSEKMKRLDWEARCSSDEAVRVAAGELLKVIS